MHQPEQLQIEILRMDRAALARVYQLLTGDTQTPTTPGRHTFPAGTGRIIVEIKGPSGTLDLTCAPDTVRCALQAAIQSPDAATPRPTARVIPLNRKNASPHVDQHTAQILAAMRHHTNSAGAHS